MPPNQWDAEDSDSSSPSSPPPVVRRGKFDDEEEDDDVLESWDAADDSETEREKVKKAEEAKAKADAEAKANHKSKAQRVAEHREANMRRRMQDDDEDSSEDEDDSARRARLRAEQKAADLKHAEDLFGDLPVASNRSGSKHITVQGSADPTSAVDLSTLPLFNPQTKNQFTALREALSPLLAANAKKAHYVLFMQEFVKEITKDLPSDQIKKCASALTTLTNEKMKEEKAAEKGGKKSKAKSKPALSANRAISHKADVSTYDEDGLDDGDFM
ncbi:translation initiation factor eIF3 subunit [Microthyrium microscopicum]|uniref:Eukaryotic translation initiation factor 3 subunit J n=1 Tax=Microthyrium microscopicum TaxID=703497 RepID=A0A6A6U2V9_9PEZI|nr:translation initiation factor eIF3 subunit [Microthyrium microscopicum]